jgi:hypothetical protein
VRSGGTSSTVEFLIYFCCILTIISVVTFTVCFSFQEKYKDEVIKKHGECFHWRTSPLMIRLSVPAEVEKHMDSEMQSIFLTL